MKKADHSGFTRSQMGKFRRVSSPNFPKPGIRFRIGSNGLNCNNTLINSCLKGPHILNMKKPQNFGSFINHWVPGLKTKAILSEWVRLALKSKWPYCFYHRNEVNCSY